MRTFSLLTFSYFFVACQPLSTSETKHDIGKTSNPRQVNFQKCETTAMSKNFPESMKLIETIGSDIMNSYTRNVASIDGINSPFTEDSEYAPNSFCFNIDDNEDFNAFAMPNGNITFHTQAILEMQNDAMLAAVMAHEIAHVTMQHSTAHHPKFTPDQNYMDRQKEINKLLTVYLAAMDKIEAANKNLFLLLENNPDEGARYKAMRTINKMGETLNEIFGDYSTVDDFFSEHSPRTDYLKERNEVMAAIMESEKESANAQFDIIETQYRLLAKEGKNYGRLAKQQEWDKGLLGTVGIEEASNWQEQEADDVGYEFYRCSGWEPKWYEIMEQHLGAKSMSATEINQCIADSLKALWQKDDNLIPDRGIGTHPTSCWRIYNIYRESLVEHVEDYKKCPSGKTELSTIQLAKAQEEIRNYNQKIDDHEMGEFESSESPGEGSGSGSGSPDFPSDDIPSYPPDSDENSDEPST